MPHVRRHAVENRSGNGECRRHPYSVTLIERIDVEADCCHWVFHVGLSRRMYGAAESRTPAAAAHHRPLVSQEKGRGYAAGSGAGGEDRTPDLRFTKPLHYRCATPAPGLTVRRDPPAGGDEHRGL